MEERRTLRPKPNLMKKGAKILGHHIHPVLIVFPLGLLSAGTIFDLIHFFWPNNTFGIVAFWMMVAGIAGGLVAALFGWIDWFAIPAGTRAKRIGLIHGLANVAVLTLFAVSALLRKDDIAHPTGLATALAVVGFAISGLGGWLGGELVERLGIGVDPNAHPDAPNSLLHETVRREQ